MKDGSNERSPGPKHNIRARSIFHCKFFLIDGMERHLLRISTIYYVICNYSNLRRRSNKLLNCNFQSHFQKSFIYK